MKVAVIAFPGSGGVKEAVFAYRDLLGHEVFTVWHQEESVKQAELVVLPGGSAFGDYLRPGALAKTSPICGAIRKHARDGKPMLGLGNGFQILCELDILPGVLLSNMTSRFLNENAYVMVDNTKSIWTKNIDPENPIKLPISCYFGRYYLDKRTLKDMEEQGHIAFRYSDVEGDVDMSEPYNGSVNAIAGILSRHENVLGLMLHPERAVEEISGNTSGLKILSSIF
jgi:phosphoribosylformylglycinamidine synthase subunit PurQ / glutaminase